MPNHLSVLGIIHTAISILALLAAFYALIRTGYIDPQLPSGKAYVLLTVVTCLTGLPIMRTGHFGPGHALAIMVLVVLAIAIYIKRLRIFGSKWEYWQVGFMTFTLFLSFVPTITETLTRLPISHPLAAGPDDPLVKMWLGIAFVVFLLVLTWQLFRLHTRHKNVLLRNA